MVDPLDIATRAAIAAAEEIRRIWETPGAWVVDKEAGKGPLTEADLAANAVLEDVLRSSFPDDGWLSEETRDDPARLGRERVWIVDPLDGTQEFVDRVPQFVVSVGLVVHGKPVLGVLVHPVLGTVLAGVKGAGATLDGAPTRVTERHALEGARILVSRSEMKKGWFDAIADKAILEPVGSVAWKLGLVACGQADATFTPRPRNTWDLAGGAAIVAAAGGRCSDNQGRDYAMNEPSPLLDGVLVSNGHLHAELLELSRALQASGAHQS